MECEYNERMDSQERETRTEFQEPALRESSWAMSVDRKTTAIYACWETVLQSQGGHKRRPAPPRTPLSATVLPTSEAISPMGG